MVSRRRRDARNHRDDRGFTLIEMLIAMGVFSIFLVIVISSVVGVIRTSSKIAVISKTSAGSLAVFQRFDRLVRYADAINSAGVGASGTSYLEFRIPATGSATGVTTCYQFAYAPSTRSIQMRSWPDVAASTASSWARLESPVASGAGAGYPFQMYPAGTRLPSGVLLSSQALVVTVNGGSDAVSGASISSTFIARNSSISSPTNTQTVANVSDTLVCNSDIASARP